MKNRNKLVTALFILGLLAIIVFFNFDKLTYLLSDNILSKELVCNFPCWQQITPQETDFSEALSKMREKNLIKFADENNIAFQVNDITGSIIRSSDGKVAFINLSIKYQAARLGDVVELIGGPEKMRIGHSPSGECYIYVLFPKNGTVVEMYLQNKSNDLFICRVSIAPESRIFRIILLGNDIYNYYYWRRSLEDSEFVEWKGYGTYSK